MNEILRNNIKSLKLNGVMVEITCKDSAGLTLVKDTMRANTATFGVFKGSMTVPNNSFVRYTYNDAAASEAAFKKLQAIVGTAPAASTTTAPAAPKETPTTAVEAIPVDTTAETTTETTTEATSEQPLDSKPLKTKNKKTIVIAAVALVALVALVFIIKKKRK